MTDTQKYDVIVVGGGPAGSAAAYTLASKAVRTCIVDKSSFPREKLCGGLITLRSKVLFSKIFGIPLESDLLLRSDNVMFLSHGTVLSEQLGYSSLFFTMRKDFDAYLLDLATQAGANTRLDTRITKIDFDSNVVTLESGEDLQFDFLVGADGVNSQVAKELFGRSFDPHTIGFGLEVEVPRERLPNQPDVVEIDFGAAHWGYGWIFPKKRGFTFGVGGIHRLNPDLRQQLAHFLERKGLHLKDFRVKGQFIPFGDYRRYPGKHNVLLCGDAAGVVDPITGEGIAYAMQTGAAAATAIIEAQRARKPQSALGLYAADYTNVSRNIKQATIWRCLIFPQAIHKMFAWAFADAGTLQRGFLDILAGKHDYNALPRLFFF